VKRKHIVWGAVVAALVVTPAVVGLLVVGDDGGRTKGALVQEGGPTAYQLTMDGVTALGQAIDVKSFSWGGTSPTTIGSATGGAGVGKLAFDEFVIVKKIDEASPKLFQKMAAGTQSATAVLKLYKGAEKPTVYAIYTFKTVFVTKVNHSGNADAVPDEQVTMVFGSGTLQMADPNGKLAAGGWNQVTNVAALP
jgi:type VI secretion system secreted protein Hcp